MSFIVARIERILIAVLVAGTAGLAAYVALRGLRMPPFLASPLVALLFVGGVSWLERRLPETLDGVRRRRPWLSAAWLLLGLTAFGQTARMSAFMLDPGDAQHSLFPGDPWYVAHCCLTAYSESARLAKAGTGNLYEPAGYLDRKLESFNVDAYHYPPPFLLLPLAAQAAVGGSGAGGIDFLAVRELWFGASALALLVAFGLLASRLEPEARLRAIAASPAVWISIPVQLGLQMSNFQVMVVSISVLALVVFPRRAALGGALLAMSVVSKIFPGILFVYLVARRRWREAAWTVGFGALFSLLALALLGPEPFRWFLEYELPRLSSGEAFARPFSRAFAVAHNMAPFGLPLKLAHLGVPRMTLKVGHAVSLVYGLCVVALAFWSARRPPRSFLEQASVWLALLSLGTLVSPFAPANYVLVSLVWLVCIDRDLFRPGTAAVVWLLTSLPFLLPREGPFLWRAIAYLPAQVLAIAVPGFVLWRAGRELRLT